MAQEISPDQYESLFLEHRPLIDVRAPVEFEPGCVSDSAVNLPLMNDDERHQVGIRYKEGGQDSAIALGAELVTPALARGAYGAQWSALCASTSCTVRSIVFGVACDLASVSNGWPRPVSTTRWFRGGYKALRSYLMARSAGTC